MVSRIEIARCCLLPIAMTFSVAAFAQNYVDVDVGVVYADVSPSEPSPIDGNFEQGAAGYHFGVGAYRNNDQSRWVYGVKLEIEDVLGSNLLSVRALDLGYKITPGLTINGFIGAGRYDLATPAYGYRAGIGGHYWIGSRWALTVEAVYGDALARDKLFAEENPGIGSPDIFFDIVQLIAYIKYRF